MFSCPSENGEGKVSQTVRWDKSRNLPARPSPSGLTARAEVGRRGVAYPGRGGIDRLLKRTRAIPRSLPIARTRRGLSGFLRRSLGGVRSSRVRRVGAGPLKLDAFIVGQLFAMLCDWQADSEATLGEGIETLAEAAREEVVGALMNGLGGASELYSLLW